MKPTDTSPTDLPNITAEDITRAFRRLLSRHFTPRRHRTTIYPGATRRGDGFDDVRLAEAAAKRTRRAQRNLRNAR